jgi:surface polysaccharide O-acyltransferase-like enzyme
MILWFAAGVGIISFLVRIAFPVGWTLNPVGFQLAHFPQYVALFILGLVAMGFSIIVALLTYGKVLWNKSSLLMGKLSRNAYAVYIFHPLVLVVLALSLRNWDVDPALKFLVVAPVAIVGSFLLAAVITSIPGVRKIV